MRHVLEELTQRADVVLVDGPPLLAVADTAALASSVDGVLLVLRAGRTRRAAAQRAVEQLQQVEANLLGVVLNDVSKPEGSYYYGRGYYDRGDGRRTRSRKRSAKTVRATVPQSGRKRTAGSGARGSDITTGPPRLGALTQSRRRLRRETRTAELGGVVHNAGSRDRRSVTLVDSEIQQFARGWEILVEDGDRIRSGQPVAAWRDERKIVAAKSGWVRRKGRRVRIVHERPEDQEDIPATGVLLVEAGQRKISRAGSGN
jgi:hypothetical protein